MVGVRQPHIITTDKWGARPPKQAPVICPRPTDIVFHHTAGHHHEISRPQDESLREAIRYAKDIQNFHMDGRGWNDSGHNYLVTLAGHILVGRHQSYNANLSGAHVISAHCPGMNDQIGIEHEHLHEVSMTGAQFASSARLHAWLMSRCAIRVGRVSPHSAHFPTECPGELTDDIRKIIVAAAKILNEEGRRPAGQATTRKFIREHT